MNKLLENISELQSQMINNKDLEKIINKLDTIPKNISKLNEKTYNDFYNFENKIIETKIEDNDMFFPKDSLEIQDSNPDYNYQIFYDNIKNRNSIFSLFRDRPLINENIDKEAGDKQSSDAKKSATTDKQKDSKK